jgi:hypothetical protein
VDPWPRDWLVHLLNCHGDLWLASAANHLEVVVMPKIPRHEIDEAIEQTKVREHKAVHTQLSNDLFWQYYDSVDGFIRWSGYNDSYWWTYIAPSQSFTTKLGKSGNRYILDPSTCKVTIE